MAWWIPLAMAAGGYMIDKQMGGNGMKGALLGAAGGAFMPSGAGLTSGAAATTAGGTGATMTGFGGAGAISPYASSGLLGTGGVGMGGWGSGSVGGMTGTGFSPVAKAALPYSIPVAAKGSYSPALTTSGAKGVPSNTTGLFDNWSNPIDFIKDGFSDMTFADQLGVGMQAEGLLNRPTRRDQYPDITELNRKQFNQGNKYETQVQDGIPIAPEPKITEEELRRLLDSQY
jgi:hypothetical protein